MATETTKATETVPIIGQEPYIWLHDDEPEGQAACGCLVQAEYSGDGPDGEPVDAAGNPALFFCRMHAAARAMYEALRDLLVERDQFSGDAHGVARSSPAWDAARAVLAELDA